MKKWQIYLIVGIIILLGLGIRLIDITDHPFEIHGSRQMRSALIARDLFSGNNDIFNTYGMIEPPILESLSAAAYFLAGYWGGGLSAGFDKNSRVKDISIACNNYVS